MGTEGLSLDFFFKYTFMYRYFMMKRNYVAAICISGKKHPFVIILLSAPCSRSGSGIMLPFSALRIYDYDKEILENYAGMDCTGCVVRWMLSPSLI